jgi:hypothetical protein
MPISGKFEADFAAFHTAVESAEVKLRSFEGSSARVETQLNRMVDSFSGRKVIQEAELMERTFRSLASQGIGLTDAELQRMGATATEAIAKMRAMGIDVPPGLQRIADEARGAAEETLRLDAAGKRTGDGFTAWTGKFDIQKAISDPVGTAKEGVTAFAETLGPTGVKLLAVSTVAVAVGAALFKLSTDAAAVGAGLDDMHDKTDLSVPALSRLSNASQVIGADMGQLTDVVFKLQTGIGENSKEFQAGLAKMGLSTNELKAAGPDRYLELITAGLKGIPDSSARAAAGTAVLGRGYRDVAAALTDLDAGFKATADLSPWTAEQAARAEEFEQNIASLTTHVSAAAIAVGNELIPAASGLIDLLDIGLDVLRETVNLGGLVSGSYHLITGALGETALAQQTSAAVTDTTTRLFAEEGATAASVAAKMLELGYSQQTVTTATGLTGDAVRRLAGDLIATKTAAEQYINAWERINGLLASGIPSIDGVSASTRGLVADMRAAGAEIADIVIATGLSVQQIALLEKAQTAGASSAKAHADAMMELHAAGVGWRGTLNTINGATVEAIKWYLAAGVSQGALATAYGLTAVQIKAVASLLADEIEATKILVAFRDAAHARQLEIVAAEAANNAKRAQVVNAQVVAELDAQVKLNAAYGLTATGQGKLTSAADTYQRALTALHATKAAGIAQSAQEQVLADAFTQQLYDEAIAIDEVNAAFWRMRDAEIATAEAARHVDRGIQGITISLDLLNSAVTKSFGDPGWFGWAPVGASAPFRQGGVNPFSPVAPPGSGTYTPPPGRAAGGPVEAGKSYLVGDRADRQPEIFTPGASGFISPLGSTSTTVIYHNTFQIVDTEANIARRVSEHLTRQLMSGRKLTSA